MMLGKPYIHIQNNKTRPLTYTLIKYIKDLNMNPNYHKTLRTKDRGKNDF